MLANERKQLLPHKTRVWLQLIHGCMLPNLRAARDPRHPCAYPGFSFLRRSAETMVSLGCMVLFAHTCIQAEHRMEGLADPAYPLDILGQGLIQSHSFAFHSEKIKPLCPVWSQKLTSQKPDHLACCSP